MRKQRKPKPPVESEASIQRRIVDYLEAHGWFVYLNRSGKMNALAGRMSGGSAKDNGSPDLFCWKWGKPTRILGDNTGDGYITRTEPCHFAVEVKRPGGKQSDAQVAWAGRYCATGHSYLLAYDHSDVERFLKGKGWL